MCVCVCVCVCMLVCVCVCVCVYMWLLTWTYPHVHMCLCVCALIATRKTTICETMDLCLHSDSNDHNTAPYPPFLPIPLLCFQWTTAHQCKIQAIFRFLTKIMLTDEEHLSTTYTASHISNSFNSLHTTIHAACIHLFSHYIYAFTILAHIQSHLL